MRLVYFSPAAAQTMGALKDVVRSEFGVDVDDLMGMSIHEFHKNPARVEQIMATPGALPHHSVFELGGLQLMATITAVQDRAGQVTGFIAIVDNVTQRHELVDHLVQAAADLGESSANLASLADDLAVTIDKVTDMAAGTDQLITSIRTVSTAAAEVARSTQAARPRIWLSAPEPPPARASR